MTVDGSPADDGLEVEARLGGTDYSDSVLGGGTATTSDGEYGRGTAVDVQVRADDLATGDREGMRAGELWVLYVDDQQATNTVVSPGDFSPCATALATSGIDTPEAGDVRSNYPFCGGVASQLDLDVPAAPPPTDGGGGGAPPAPTNTTPSASSQDVATAEDTPVSITFLLVTLPRQRRRVPGGDRHRQRERDIGQKLGHVGGADLHPDAQLRRGRTALPLG